MELLVVAAALAVLALAIVLIYNRLVRLRNDWKNAFSQIDVQLKRRHDLVPMLVEAVKGYMKHERETLDAVIQARNSAERARRSAGAPGGLAQLGMAEGILDAAVGRIFALSEAYPDLKASQNFLQYQEELSSTENRIAYARQAYNDAVATYNTAIESIPANLIAGPFGFKQADLLEFADKEAIQVPPNGSFA